MKGATIRFQPLRYGQAISIHAPVKGATQGDDQVVDTRIVISIHAPVKGATKSHAVGDICSRYFNPRTREGCDMIRPYVTCFDGYISIHAPVKGAT